MREIALGPVVLYTWGLFVALAVLVAAAYAAARARRYGLESVRVWDVAFWVTVTGFLGARLAYVIEYWQDFSSNPWQVIAVWEGGMSALGAVVAGIIVGVWYARRHGLPITRFAAAIAPALLLGDAIGRLGGATSHMYPGRLTTFPISYVLQGVRRHEVGVELSLASLAGFLVALSIARRAPRAVAPFVLLWYSGERFLLDFLRATDLPISDLRYAGLTLAQYAALGGIFVAGALFFRLQRLDAPGA